jgi:hypothetical protein
MFVGNAPYIRSEGIKLDYAKRQCLEEPEVGKPEIYIYGGLAIKTSGNLIHQAYHVSQTSVYLPELETIVEIGGGYGAMALVCHRLGFRGRYIIYDLPEFSLLQQYYLSNVGVEGVEFKTQIDKQIECDLLIGLYSLSEMPLAARETIIDLCPAQSYLISYQGTWDGVDNMAWAMGLMKQKKCFTWNNWNIPHLPNCWYLAGDKRDKKMSIRKSEKQIKMAENKFLRMYEQDSVIYAQINNGTKHQITSIVDTFQLDRIDCDDGQARIVWPDGKKTFLNVSGEAITVL